MDGNRRWAKAKEKPSLEGHAEGYQALRTIITAVHTAHIPHMVCYAFSTENWKRTEEEVGYLMNLMNRALTELSEKIASDPRKINLRVIGEQERLPENLQTKIAQIERENHADPELTVWIAISYGGRSEIVHAVNHAIARGEKVTEDTFGELLFTNGMPDPDLIIRTSGEKRLSNFLLWQSAYSELFFTDTLWPDFGESEFQSIVEEYGTRKRRRGV
jgi:undecaprenyl diphosphate synthase